MILILLLFILAPQRAVGMAYGAALMFSVPPQTTISDSPARIWLAAMATLFRPEPHTILIVTAVVSIGSPAFKDT